MTALPNSDMQNKAPTTNGTAAMPITVTHNKMSSTGVSRMPISAASAVCPGWDSSVCTHWSTPSRNISARTGVKGQKAQGQCPSPAESRCESQGPAVDQTVIDPGVQPAESGDPADVRIEDSLYRAVHHRAGVAMHPAQHRDHIAADFGVRSQLDAAQHRDHIAIHLGVDVVVAEDGDRIVADRTRDPRIAEDRDHIPRFAVTGRRSEYRYHRLSLLSGFQMTGTADVDDIAVVVMLPTMPMVRSRSACPSRGGPADPAHRWNSLSSEAAGAADACSSAADAADAAALLAAEAAAGGARCPWRWRRRGASTTALTHSSVKRILKRRNTEMFINRHLPMRAIDRASDRPPHPARIASRRGRIPSPSPPYSHSGGITRTSIAAKPPGR